MKHVVERSNEEVTTFGNLTKRSKIFEHFINKFTTNDPFFIVNLDEIINKLEQWKTNLPKVKPFYAIKCNPDMKIIKLLGDHDVNFDCASKEEIKKIMSLGFDTSRIIYANPCKSPEFIKFAKNNNIKYMTFDSEEELKKIKINHPESDLIIRIKVDDHGSVCKFSSKFGCSKEHAIELLKISNELNLNVVGVSFHVGSNCKSLGYFENAIKESSEIFKLAYKLYNIKMNILDIGGGFPGTDNFDNAPTFEKLAVEINDALDKYFSDIDSLQIIAEPGRYFATSSHILLVNIIGIKFDPDLEEIKYTINDGVYGSFNCIIYDHVEPNINIVKKTKNNLPQRLYKTTIFGPTCDSMDTITKTAIMPKLNIGDWCYVENFGAYTKAASSNFNGFENPKSYYYQFDH